MRALPLRLVALWFLLVPGAVACGGDDDGGDSSDGPVIDAALGADSSEVLPDAGATTTCGDDPVMYCDRASQICVERDLGAGLVWECLPLPDGCDQTRDCASCSDVCNPSDDCLDSDADNTITCACTQCA